MNQGVEFEAMLEDLKQSGHKLVAWTIHNLLEATQSGLLKWENPDEEHSRYRTSFNGFVIYLWAIANLTDEESLTLYIERGAKSYTFGGSRLLPLYEYLRININNS